MKVCIACEAPVQLDWKCPKCQWEPVEKAGIKLLSKIGDNYSESYDPKWFVELARLEEGNFWFEARNDLLSFLCKKYFAKSLNYLEIGCGTGFVLKRIHQDFPGWNVVASEVFSEGLHFAKQRLGDKTDFYQIDAQNLPYENEFDVIGAFDVVEHIENDRKAFEQMQKALKPSGSVILSVPQHMFLWSRYDELGHHYRRYSEKELSSKLVDAGFEIIYTTSFMTLLMPIMLLSRLMKKDKNKEIDVLDELRISSSLNAALKLVTKLEIILVRMGIRWPFGGSRIIIAKRCNP